MKAAIQLVERGLVPKPLIRRGIRRLLGERLREQGDRHAHDREAALRGWVDRMRADAIAPVPHKANEQHYEVPPGFFSLVLGKRLKYSSAYYPSDETRLDDAEEAMLSLTCERAGLEDGQRVLELGCGWGSLTLWMAERHPNSRIVAVSNSAGQRAFIQGEARRRNLSNVEVLTRDMNDFTTDERFDRVVSVEMFEHMRNWEALLARIARWLRPEGRVFLHVFAHREYAYPFEARDASDWMSRYFFTGGMMPARRPRRSPGPSVRGRRAVERLRQALRPYVRGLAPQPRVQRAGGPSAPAIDLRPGRRRALVPALARVLPRLRRALRLRRRKRVARGPHAAAREARAGLVTAHTASKEPRGLLASVVRWLDSWAADERDELRDPREIDWLRVVPFLALHASCLLVIWVGWSWTALAVAAGYYGLRMFAITAFYHRYFSHRSFLTSRPIQFVFALLGATAVQRGPIWWASHHRAHHRHSDAEGDVHSPERDGFWWSHLGWILCRENFRPRLELVRDLTRFPELRFLDRFDVLVPLLTIPLLYLVGEGLGAVGLGTNGAQILVWRSVFRPSSRTT